MIIYLIIQIQITIKVCNRLDDYYSKLSNSEDSFLLYFYIMFLASISLKWNINDDDINWIYEEEIWIIVLNDFLLSTPILFPIFFLILIRKTNLIRIVIQNCYLCPINLQLRSFQLIEIYIHIEKFHEIFSLKYIIIYNIINVSDT